MQKELYIGKTPYRKNEDQVSGRLVDMFGESFYLIENYDQMPPFFMAIVGSSDHWMYISSTGGLTAGRANPDKSIFPYYTDDKIHESASTTGSKTVIIADNGAERALWEPFSDGYKGAYVLKRNLYKSCVGNKLIFEEINLDLQLAFRYMWTNSDKFGWVKKSTIENLSDKMTVISILDGVQNVLPFGILQNMQSNLSTLMDAYKKTELHQASGLGLFRMTSIPVDRAEPSEALKCNTVWKSGLNDASLLLSSRQLSGFKSGLDVVPEIESLGVKGAFFSVANFDLLPAVSKQWYYVLDVEKDTADVAALINLLRSSEDLSQQLEADIQLGTDRLINLVALADGQQQTADAMTSHRHFSNVLFNCMRGGVFGDGYLITTANFKQYLKHSNSTVFAHHQKWVGALPKELLYQDLVAKANALGDSDLVRLTYGFLPLVFSRRHGDPSRPWNRFDIKIKNADGTLSTSYQGNWRDIFQNWEALAMSFPDYLPGMIARFLNASTIDGYNPYRISSEGLDWEVPDPEDPWAFIGYWGDHQIVYLLKLLELSAKMAPDQLMNWLHLPLFSYANVPYRIKGYDSILLNPQDTIVFDQEKNIAIEHLVAKIGADGKLVMDAAGQVVKASLTEKLLVSLLAKLSNFVPDGGIWMNTQRPEWNDANNALVGNGCSMVTLYYMSRMVRFMKTLYGTSPIQKYEVRSEVVVLLRSLTHVLTQYESLLVKGVNDEDRKSIMDGLGNAGTDYREQVYSNLSDKLEAISLPEMDTFLSLVQKYIDRSISNNKRSDGLYHAYNLVTVKGAKSELQELAPMLEGQVALLSSGALNPSEALKLLSVMYDSALYRADQNSFMLYPNKQLPLFLEKNNISPALQASSKLITKLLANNDQSIVKKDLNGSLHFCGDFTNVNVLKAALQKLPNDYKDLVAQEQDLIAEMYETVFNHKSFTGRSGVFYKYEGLGCIYWHMVSKLLLAIGENIQVAVVKELDEVVVNQLITYYYKVREGIGVHKTPDQYGAFPMDPYSHTPSMMGVQQPGMTGQVKEDILSRFMELGLTVKNGCIGFLPNFLHLSEFFADADGLRKLKFTYCSVPITYTLGETDFLKIKMQSGNVEQINGLWMEPELSKAIFARSGSIAGIEVVLSPKRVLQG